MCLLGSFVVEDEELVRLLEEEIMNGNENVTCVRHVLLEVTLKSFVFLKKSIAVLQNTS